MKIARVLFLRPPLSFDPRLGHEEPHPPIECLYLAGALETRYEVRLLDGMTGIRRVESFGGAWRRAGMNDEEIRESIEEFDPQVVCLSSMWINQKSMLLYAASVVKSVNRSIITVAGGLLPSSCPEIISKDPAVNFTVIGEGEKTLPLLLERLEKGETGDLPLGVVSGSWNSPSYPRAPLTENLDDLAMPAYRLVDFANYTTALEFNHVKAIPFIGVLPTRGCTYGCTFCSLPNVTERRYRHHSVERVLLELETLKQNYGVREVHFYDANLLNSTDFAKDLFRAMIAQKVNLPWVPEAGLSLWALDDETMELAVASGMYRVDLPIESASKKVRKEIMDKDLFDGEAVRRAIRKFRSLGIERIYGYIMLGNPGESKKDIQESLDLLNDLDLDYKGVRFAKPFPNTRFYDICRDSGYLKKNFSLDDLWFGKPVIETGEFSLNYLNAVVQADRALALKRLGRRGLLSSIARIFRHWGFRTGLESLVYLVVLGWRYRRLRTSPRVI
jgi:anaerobic magnesium-protoporphyrin IX monomethyl ester cyclase